MDVNMYEFYNERRLIYGDGAMFLRRCAKCCRFIKAPKTMSFSKFTERYIEEDNTVCSQCGPTHLIFEGFI